MDHFKYSEKELSYLKKRDPKLGEIIDKLGFLERAVTKDLFVALVESIISQQISGKAAITVIRRVYELLGEITPLTISRTNHFKLKECGMSLKKASYLKVAADAVLSGFVNFEEFSKMTDSEIIEKLISLPGVGVWTAEMLMIFSLERPNILSFDDLIIRRSIQKLYGLSDFSREAFNEIRELYSPYCSVASLYLWEV